MKIKTPFGQILPDKYAKKASVTVKGSAVISFPFEVEDLPAGTKSLAWTLVDYDSIPVCGFAYIHWTVANVPVNGSTVAVAEDFSRQDKSHTHGKNSLVSKFLSEDLRVIDDVYIGPYPPDKDHVYTLEVYALDSFLDLAEPFYLNELKKQAQAHLLATAQLELIGRV